MPHESRIKKSLLNAKVNLLFYFLSLFVSFFSRKIFLSTLGDEFVGLSSTLGNLLNFLNLAELGIGSAIGYLLYKPLFADNRQKINEIIAVFGYIYQRIGFIILGAGCALACFLPFIFPDTPFSYGVIYFAYFSMLASSLFSYFFNYKQTLLGADQRNYVVTIYYQSAVIAKTLLQMAVAYYTGNYYLWIALELLLGIFYAFILNVKIKQVYPWLEGSIRQGKQLFKSYPEVISYTKQLFVHKLAVFVQFQTSPLLIYAFVSLKTVAHYGNYTIIIDKITHFVNNLLSGTNASVGNLIAEGDTKKIQSIFWELIGIRFLIAGCVSFGLLQLTEPFITLWLGENYILPYSVFILLIINSFINYTRGAVDQFLYGYGLFYDTWAPIAEIGINLTVSIIGGSLWGLSGILLGNTASLLLIVCIWKPYFLYSKGFKKSIVFYWKKYLAHLLILLLTGGICWKLLSLISSFPQRSFLYWGIYGIATVTSYDLICSILFYICFPEFRFFIHRFIKKIH